MPLIAAGRFEAVRPRPVQYSSVEGPLSGGRGPELVAGTVGDAVIGP